MWLIRALSLAVTLAIAGLAWTALTAWLIGYSRQLGLHMLPPVAWALTLLAALLLAYLSTRAIAWAIRKQPPPARPADEWEDLKGE